MTELSTRLTFATTVLGAEVLKLHSFEGHEALSTPFQFTVTLGTKDDKPVELAALLGTIVKVTLEQESTASKAVEQHPKRYFNGYVAEVSQRTVKGTDKWLYTVVLRPWLWLLGKTKECRIFQQKTVPEIVREVFTNRGFNDFELRLSKNYPPREYCVQYRESDLDFVSRLLEHEGIYYYFEFDEQKHKLILIDDTKQHQPKPTYATIECGPIHVDDATQETFGGRIHDWRPKLALRSETYVLKDYDFTRPTVLVEGEAKGEEMIKEASLEKFDYPGDFLDASVGEKYATVRMLEERSQAELRTGKATSHGLSPGYTFTMAKNRDPSQNVTYLTVGAKYEFAVMPYESRGAAEELQPKDWSCEFTALATTTQFRPARVTPRPVIAGVQTAKVVGGSSDEILTDTYGRVKVQFHWDRYGKSNERSSCFIRTAQTWAGANWGSQYVPRVGNEVVVSYLEGDPDRPLIVGSAYNGLNLPPFELPQQKEVSGVKTKSTLNGGTGHNELSLEDTKGQEVIHVHAQRNMRTVVEKHRYTKVGGDDTEIVKGDQYVSVTKTYTLDSLVATELACGPTVIKLTPLGLAITAPKIDIDAAIFSLDSPMAVITPAVYTVPLGPRPWVSPPPPRPAPPPSPEDKIGGKRENPTTSGAGPL